MVEAGGEEVPEEFRPEEAADRGGDLVCTRGVNLCVRVGNLGEGEGNVQVAAVRMMRRAQWFFMSLPITRR